MKSFYAICPFCNKSIFVEENLSGGYACPLCSQALGLDYLRRNNFIISNELAEREYNFATGLFEKSDFKTAEAHFKKVCEYNRNHYSADYYLRLCEIYQNEESAEFDLPHKIVEALKSPIKKLDLCQVGYDKKIEFISSALNQVYIIISSHLSRIYEIYEKTEKWDILRDKSLNLASAVKELIDIDKELLMVFDPAVAKSLLRIADLGICACQKVVQPHKVSDTVLDLPADYAYEKARNIYNQLFFYATSLDSEYKFSSYKPDYTSNLVYNQSVKEKLERYNSENKPLAKKFLSSPGPILESFRKDAAVALKYTYHTCFKGLNSRGDVQTRGELVRDSIAFGFELILPRIYVYDNRVRIDAKNFAKASDIAFFLNEFLKDMYESNAKLANEIVSEFFRSVYESVKYYYTLVYNGYGKIADRLKELQNEDFTYYKDFLHHAIYACAVALKEIVYSDDKRTVGDRLKLLKLGKSALDEFLLLSDYKIDELDCSAQYSDVLTLFNSFENNIEEFAKR